MFAIASSVRSRLLALLFAAATTGPLTGCSHTPTTPTPVATMLGPAEQVWWHSTTSGPPSAGAPRRVTIELPGDVLFEANSAVLTPGAATQLDAARRRYLAPDRGATVEVVGHTNPDGGPPMRTVTLSRARADAIAAWLEGHGTAARRITTQGRGDREPKYPSARPCLTGPWSG